MLHKGESSENIYERGTSVSKKGQETKRGKRLIVECCDKSYSVEFPHKCKVKAKEVHKMELTFIDAFSPLYFLR